VGLLASAFGVSSSVGLASPKGFSHHVWLAIYPWVSSLSRLARMGWASSHLWLATLEGVSRFSRLASRPGFSA